MSLLSLLYCQLKVYKALLTKRINRFDTLASLAPLSTYKPSDELRRYLQSDPEDIKDAVAWWHEHRSTYPRLSRMALDYLTIPGKSNKYFLFIYQSDLSRVS